MKILLVSPVNHQLKNHRPLPVWQAQNFWRLALIQLGHQVKVFRLNDFPRLKPVKSLQLKNTINRYRPDQIFFSAGTDQVKPFPQTIFFSGVAPKTLSKHERQIGLHSRLLVVNDPKNVRQWQRLGASQAVCLPISAVDPNFFKPDKHPKTIPLSFIATLYPGRQRFLSQLVKQLPQLQIYGYLPPQLELLPELKPYYHGPAWGSQLKQIYCRSKISLNLVPEHLPLGGNLRTFEIPATNTLMLTDKLNPDWYVPDKEAVVFKNLNDLIRKANYYLKNPSQASKIAKAGYQRTIKDHTYYQRFKKLLTLIK